MTPSPTAPSSDDPLENEFAHRAHAVLPTGASGRLARALEVNQRLAQRWLKGEMPPTSQATEFVETQYSLVDRLLPAAAIERLVEGWIAAGLDREVIASHLAAIYERVTNRQIE